jgi:hypothetical protein
MQIVGASLLAIFPWRIACKQAPTAITWTCSCLRAIAWFIEHIRINSDGDSGWLALLAEFLRES